MIGLQRIRLSTRRRSIGFVIGIAWILWGSGAALADPGYLALWREDSAEVRYRVDVSHAKLGDVIASQKAAGYRVGSLDVRDYGINVRRYALVFRPGSGGQYWATGKDIDEFKVLDAKRLAEGYRIAAFDVDDGYLYATWRPGSGEQRWRAGMSWGQFENRNEEYAADGLRLTALKKYDGDRFAAVWRSGSGNYLYASGRTLAQFEELDEEARAKGLRLDWIDTYDGKFLAIWRPGTGEQAWWAGLSESGLEAAVEQKTSQGLRLRMLRSKDYDSLSSSPPPVQKPKQMHQCGIGCPEGYYPYEYDLNLKCEGGKVGVQDNETLCKKIEGANFVTCGLGCLDDHYEVDKYDFNSRCVSGETHTAAMSDNLTFCKLAGSGSSGQAQSALTQAPVTMLARPAIIGRRLGQLDVMGRGMDRRFYHSWWNGQVWTTWSAIGAGTFLTGPAVATETRRGAEPRLHVAGQGDDRRIWWATWDGETWSGWSPVGEKATFTSAPALAGGPSPVLVARGDDRRMWIAEHAGSWSGWTPIGDGTFLTAPTVIRQSGRLGVFAVGDDRGLWGTWRENGTWTGWSRIGDGTFRSAPTAVTWGADRLDLFALGDDRKVYQVTWTPGKWTRHPLDGVGVFRSAPAAWSAQANRIDLVAVGEDGRIRHKAWNGSQWSAWLKDTPVGQFQ